ncbi:hypothetical protein QBC46DRAFT_419446 [Diplogelasinospora grovesii]|uniref:Uncharacterized protein n=1 Tax=Diplogelasinospora grovesii TaxID=303347 RepID=A0AAN6MZG0_9PEZI|nr:hypothetical protein QBC46DRAFT_419446 [Diplogelasinospora grovesii]
MKSLGVLASVLAVVSAASVLPRNVQFPAGAVVTNIAAADIPEVIRNGTVSAENVASLSKRATIGVFLCTDANFQGHCVHIVSPTNVCVPLGSDLNDQVSSVGPDQDAGDCRFNFDAGCTDDNGCLHFDTSFPGIADLNTQSHFVCGVNNPNDKVTSYQCFG